VLSTRQVAFCGDFRLSRLGRRDIEKRGEEKRKRNCFCYWLSVSIRFSSGVWLSKEERKEKKENEKGPSCPGQRGRRSTDQHPVIDIE
jgi:hypothetical protein